MPTDAIFDWGERLAWDIPDFLQGISNFEFYDQWPKYADLAKDYFLREYHSIRLYHATRIDSRSTISSEGLKLISLEVLERNIISILCEMDYSCEDIQRCQNAEGYRSYINDRKYLDHCIYFHTSREFALGRGKNFFSGSELQRVFVGPLGLEVLPGEPALVVAEVPIRELLLENDIFRQHSLVHSALTWLAIPKTERKDYSQDLDISISFANREISPNWIVEISRPPSTSLIDS